MNLNISSVNNNIVCCAIEKQLFTFNTDREERQIWVHLQGLLSEHQPHSTDWKEKNQAAKQNKIVLVANWGRCLKMATDSIQWALKKLRAILTTSLDFPNLHVVRKIAILSSTSVYCSCTCTFNFTDFYYMHASLHILFYSSKVQLATHGNLRVLSSVSKVWENRD